VAFGGGKAPPRGGRLLTTMSIREDGLSGVEEMYVAVSEPASSVSRIRRGLFAIVGSESLWRGWVGYLSNFGGGASGGRNVLSTGLDLEFLGFQHQR
jgi:hypothetical protein